MVYTKISIHNRNLKGRIRAIKDWKITKEDKEDLIKFLDELGLGKVNRGHKVSEVRQLKYLDILKIPLEFFKKPVFELDIKDIEKFEKAITSGKLKSYKKTPYSISTQSDIKNILKVYLKWKLGDKGDKMTNWLDTKVPKKTPEYLKEEEVIKLYKSAKNSKERFLIAVLFDAGCRVEEFLNIRKEDIEEPNANSPYYKITFKEEYSKTAGRTIGLYWKYSSEAITDYLSEHHFKLPEPVYKAKYDDVRFLLQRLGKRALQRRVYAHLLRHSSATHYASKMNRQQLCYRYGWKFSSDMPDVYISRSGMVEEQVNDKFKNEEISALRERLDKYEHLLKIVLDKGMGTLREVEKKIKV